jgi:hypothetical protein
VEEEGGREGRRAGEGGREGGEGSGFGEGLPDVGEPVEALFQLWGPEEEAGEGEAETIGGRYDGGSRDPQEGEEVLMRGKGRKGGRKEGREGGREGGRGGGIT